MKKYFLMSALMITFLVVLLAGVGQSLANGTDNGPKGQAITWLRFNLCDDPRGSEGGPEGATCHQVKLLQYEPDTGQENPNPNWWLSTSLSEYDKGGIWEARLFMTLLTTYEVVISAAEKDGSLLVPIIQGNEYAWVTSDGETAKLGFNAIGLCLYSTIPYNSVPALYFSEEFGTQRGKANKVKSSAKPDFQVLFLN